MILFSGRYPLLAFACIALSALPCAASAATSLSTFTQIVQSGQADYASASIASAGDVNGDGFDDFLVGAPENDVAGVNAGAAALVYGSEDMLSATVLDEAPMFFGEIDGDHAGVAVASAGDVNGDGYDDMLIGAYSREAGSTYLIYGKSDYFSGHIALNETDANIATITEFIGEGSSGYFGYAVSSAGDVNGDGYDDLLIGAMLNDDAGSLAGAAYLVYGQAETFAQHISIAETDTHIVHAVQFTGEDSSDFAGNAVSSAGDVNGDGYDDMLVGAYNNSDAGAYAGAAYLIYGRESYLSGTFSLSESDTSTIRIVEFTGVATGDNAGVSVASAGDVNADGYSDMLIGADTGSNGVAYLVYGQAGVFVSASLSTAVVFTGVSGDNAGVSVASAGDVNADGYSDMLIGAPQNDSAASNAGAAYLVYGKSRNFVSRSLSSVVQFTGEVASAYAGYALSSAGDLNGDGRVEILVSADDDSVYLGYLFVDADHDDMNGGDGVFTGNDTNDNDFDNDGSEIGTDCNDADADVTEDLTYYPDVDGDALGDVHTPTGFCSLTAPVGYTTDISDANDNDFDNDGSEIGTDCNDADADVTEEIEYYADNDGDTFGDASNTTAVCALSAPEGFTTDFSDENDILPDAALLKNVEGEVDGNIIVTLSDDSVHTYNVYPNYSGDKLTKVAQYTGTGYVIVLQPKGKKVALVNPYTGEVIERLRLAKIKYKKNSLKLLDVRHDGSLDIVVTSRQTSGDYKVRLSLVTLNVATGNLVRKDYERLEGVSNVKASHTKSPQQTVNLRDEDKNILYTYDVDSSYEMTLR